MSLDVEKLINELTLPEKVSLLSGRDFWHTVGIERLGIPSIRVSDGPNGIRGTKFFNAVPSNCFPCGTGMASTFNKELLEEAGKLMGVEAKLKGAHVILGPTCNIARSPLGGRAFESYSEDPLLSGYAAASVIKGIQSEDVLACIKHFVCNDQEDERRAVDTILTERALREIYLKPFQIAIRDSNPKSLMTAYNKVNGTHVSQSKHLLKEILRDEWKYEGATMSDWFGLYSTGAALEAGLNLEMPGPTSFRDVITTVHKVNANAIHIDVIDMNVRYILNFINECIKVGIPKDVIESPNNSPESSELLRKVGNESIVLLKNENSVLPLSKTSRKGQESIAIIGPNVKIAQDSGGGSASLTPRYKVTPWEGIMKKINEGGNSVKVAYTLGASIDKTVPDLAPVCRTDKGDPGICCKFYKKPPGAEDRTPFDTVYLKTSTVFLSDYTNPSLKLGDILFYVDFECTFTPEETAVYEFGCSCLGTAEIFVNDKLVVDNKTKQIAGGFFFGNGTREELGEIKLEKGKTYNVKVEFATGPTSKLEAMSIEAGGITFGLRKKIDPEEEIQRALKIASESDKVVVVVGLNKDLESEGFDRPDMDIPGYTDKLIEELCNVNKNIIVVNQSGSPVTMPWAGKVQALIQAWYGGNELGNTIADVLFGDFNPSGKLSLTFPKKLEDNPSYLNFGCTNHRVLYGEDVFVGYRFYEKLNKEPLFPFGYGLSYTNFEISDLKLRKESKNLILDVKVKNIGQLFGGEVVQVYVKPIKPSVIRPVKELKDFSKVFLKPGEQKDVRLCMSLDEITSFWDDYRNKWLSEKGKYQILVGNCSDNISVVEEFEIAHSKYWTGL